MSMTQHLDMNCPGCGEQINASTPARLGVKTMPAPGDLTLCVYCGMALIFTGAHPVVSGMRRLTEKEWFALHLLTRTDLTRARRVLTFTHILTTDWRYQ